VWVFGTRQSADRIFEKIIFVMDHTAEGVVLLTFGSQLVAVVAALAAHHHQQLRKRRFAECVTVERQEVYAARKQARRDVNMHPRELLSQSVDEQAPSARRLVNVRLEHRLPISVAWQQSVMAQWTEQEFLMNLRMPKSTFFLLLDKLEAQLSYGDPSTGGKRPTPPWALLGAVLCWLGGGRAQDFIEKFGMRMECWKKRRRLAITAIVQTLGSSLKFPSTLEEMERISRSMSKWCHFPGAIGALDGLIVRVHCPDKRLKRVMRCDCHDCTGINLQAIVDGNDQFRWISTGKYGACADGRAFRETKLFEELTKFKLTCGGRALPGRFFILADNAYPIRSFLLHPFRGEHPPDSPQDTWNLNMSAARAAIERAFGQLVLTWQILKKGIHVKKIGRAHEIIKACILLHNFRKQHTTPSSFEFDFEQLVVGELRPLTAILDQNVALVGLNEGIEYVRAMVDDRVGERANEDRQSNVKTCASVGSNVRDRLAQQLVADGKVRSRFAQT
jgi:hypothetical protein